LGELKISKKEGDSAPLINKSKVREYIESKSLKISDDILDSAFFNEIVIDLLNRAIVKAKESGKDEVNESDLKSINENNLFNDPKFEEKFEEQTKVLMKHITEEAKKTRRHLTLKTRKVINEMIKNRRVDRIINMLFKDKIPPKKVMKRLLNRIKKKKFDDKEAIEYIRLFEEAVKEYRVINDVFEKTLKEKILSGIKKILGELLTSGVKGLVSVGIKEILQNFS